MKDQLQEPPKSNKEYVLEAEVKEIEYTYFFINSDNIPEIHNKKLTAKPIPLELISLAVTQDPSPELEISILNEMKYPVILTYNSPEEHRGAIKSLVNARPFEAAKPFLCIIGNQRVTIAHRNDFSHIDAFIVDTGKESLIVKKAYDGELDGQ
jgi:hypothetical protein